MPVLFIRGHDVHGGHVVERQPKAPGEPSEATAERETTDAGVRDRSGGGHQSACHCLVIELAQQATAAYVRPARGRVDAHAADVREIELHSTLAGRFPAARAAAAQRHTGGMTWWLLRM
jgi:hypothetical protein